jgi:hypothetical protein
MHLVNRNELQEKRGKSAVSQAGCEAYTRGLYVRQRTSRDRDGGRGGRPNRVVKEDIYLLSAMRTNEFVIVAAHELTHDMLRETVMQLDVAPEWVAEGACQYVGTMVARRLNATNEVHTALHRRDVVYGGGYRFFKSRFGDSDWKGLLQWLNRSDLGALPKEVPATGSLQVGR